MRLGGVVGHARAVERLRRAVAEDHVPHAFLFLGPEGVGKRALADALAARLLCADPKKDDACEACGHCTRVAAGTHPDVRLVVRDEDRRDVRIEQVRELTRWLSLQPLMASRKVAIIDGAHELNEHGQNALLRALEEPPVGSHILLLATAASLLLPTVRSRCQVVRLDRLDPAEVARVLEAKGLPAERAQLVAGVAEGSPGRALLLDGEEAVQTRARVLDALAHLGSWSAAEISAVAQELAKGALDLALTISLAFYREALELALGAQTAAPRAADEIPAIRLSEAARLRQLEAVCDTIDALGRNANRVLALETMFLALRGIERSETGHRA
jgi:DNA polymerase III subunit delta'